jgi:hypothetical protein
MDMRLGNMRREGMGRRSFELPLLAVKSASFETDIQLDLQFEESAIPTRYEIEFHRTTYCLLDRADKLANNWRFRAIERFKKPQFLNWEDKP